MPTSEALGRLLVLQNLVQGLPDEKSMLDFLRQGLADVPGVASVSYSDPGVPGPVVPEGFYAYRLLMGRSDYGTFLVEPSDAKLLGAYDAYLKNFAFTVSVMFEERRQRAALAAHQATLEIRVEESTAALRAALAEKDALLLEKDVLLQEKDVLLQELYHRTRNNMQTICALMDLESSLSADEDLRTALRDMKSRVYALSLVHTMLYRSKDLSRIPACEYVRSLGTQLQETFPDLRSRVEFRAEVQEDLLLSIDAAMPFGLALTELVVNSFRHAFPGGRRGSVSVAGFLDGDGQARFFVGDDGVGFPPGFDADRDARMGLGNFSVLVEQQLKGIASLDSASGVRWAISFPARLHTLRLPE